MRNGGPVSDEQRPPEVVLPQLAGFPEEVTRAISGYSREALVRPGRDGGWGVVEILAHLRDWEEIFFARSQAIVEQDYPYLPAYDDDLWPIERDYRGQDPLKTLDQFRELRGRHVAFLQGIPIEAWQRLGNHGHLGEISLLWMANHMVEHDRGRLEQIRDVLA